MNINPTNIHRHSRVQRIVRFWVVIILQTLILFAFMFLLGLAIVSLDAAMHPVDYDVQLPTLSTH